jgi:RES domain-containing protein
MLVYRIAKTLDRAEDISGFGAFKFGGRWNSKGTYMLYTSMNSSLAYLENLVHFNETEVPPNLYIVTLAIRDEGLVSQLPDDQYPAFWQSPENIENKTMGDEWMRAKKFLAFGVRSAINPSEFNFLLNPLYPDYHDLVKIESVKQLHIDARLLR